MASRSPAPVRYRPRHNVTGAERWISILGGLALGAAARRGNFAKRALFGVASASLLARGTTRYCAVKSAIAGKAPLGQGLADQFRLLAKPFMAGTATIDNFMTMYVNELQELHSAKDQMEELLDTLVDAVENNNVRQELNRYRQQVEQHRNELISILERCEASPVAHEDEAMEALVNETQKMRKVSGAPALRDAGLVASLQRLIHHQIAGLGTAASYAKTLGRQSEAEVLARITNDDKAIDETLSRLAKESLNPVAAHAQAGQANVRESVAMLP